MVVSLRKIWHQNGWKAALQKVGVLVEELNRCQQHILTWRMPISYWAAPQSPNHNRSQVKGVITASTTHSWNRISNTVTSFGLPKPRQQHSGARPVEGHQDCQRLDSQHKRRKIAQFLKKRIAQGDDTEIYNCLLRICRGGWARLLGGIQQKDTDNNKCATMETSTIKGEYFFLLRIVKHCNRILQILEIFNPAILKAFKAQPHKAQSKLL